MNEARSERPLDLVIIGGGPAGLNAALILGRARRRVVLCDAGRPRNAVTRELHGFLSRDGIEPAELRRIGREQLGKYETVEVRDVEVMGAVREEDGFTVTLADGGTLRSRKLLVVTGVVDRVPQVAGFDDIYGTTAFHCPYCDGWEFRDAPLAVYGPDRKALGLALELKGWSSRLTLCTDGVSSLDAHERRRLSLLGIALREEPLVAFESEAGRLRRVVFDSGPPVECEALFFNVGERQASSLARKLGCQFTEKGAIETTDDKTTKLPGLYVAGDACRGVQFAIVAAGEGAEAAVAIDRDLIAEDLAREEHDARAKLEGAAVDESVPR